ncbi:hypothetical protein [Neorhodopirellula lusitana]|uniref:hypothetical protein n=1 Tax=Neorhodopirellula lusitana TaxID=445327 RepID=UPI00384DD73F
MKTFSDPGIVADGRERAIAFVGPRIRSEVEREYEARISNASWFQRWLLRREMKRIIVMRLSKVASMESLY